MELALAANEIREGLEDWGPDPVLEPRVDLPVHVLEDEAHEGEKEEAGEDKDSEERTEEGIHHLAAPKLRLSSAKSTPFAL